MKKSSQLKPCAVVVGVGVALCKKFAQEGLPAYGVGRDATKMNALSRGFVA